MEYKINDKVVGKLPAFIIAGSGKCGSTTLVGVLNQNPEIFLQPATSTLGCEPHFFERDPKYAKGIEYYSKNYFNDANPNQVIGEKTPNYCAKWVPKRIAKHLPDVKLIFIFRNPIERAYSQWKMYTIRGAEPYSFEKALKVEHKRISKHPRWQHWGKGYRTNGEYINVINEYLKYFDKNQIMVIILEKFLSEFDQYMEILSEYLGVTYYEGHHLVHYLKTEKHPKSRIIQHVSRKLLDATPRGKRVFSIIMECNSINKIPSMKISTRKMLYDHYKEYNEKLSSFLKEPLHEWEMD